MSRFYKHIVKPILFQFDAEKIHHLTTDLSNRPIIADMLSQIESIPDGRNSLLTYESDQLKVPNPVGLAAGFDKNATLAEFCNALGFGFREVGSITAKPSSGNPKPRLFRIPEDNGLINRMGLNNDGADIIQKRIQSASDKPGVNIAKTHDPKIEGQAAIDDYVYSFNKLAPVARYITVNVSCPNTAEGKTFESPETLEELLSALSAERTDTTPPVFIKFSADLDQRTLAQLLQITEDHNVDGYVCCNTSTDRASLATSPNQLHDIGKGGISGRPVHRKSCEMLKFIREQTPSPRILTGVGGISSAEDAQELIASGADLVQLYTGLVYEGPGLVRRIQKGLISLMENYGLNSYTELKEFLRSN